MTVKMGTIWDRATEVLSGRGGMLFGIAAVTIFLPGVVRSAWALYMAAPTMLFALVNLLLVIGTLVLTLWGQLAIIAAASDPAVTASDGYRLGLRRLPASIGVTMVLLVAVIVVMLPFGIALAASGVDMRALSPASGPMQLPPATAAFIGLYGLVLGVAALFVSARLSLVNPTVLHQRRGLGAIPESWRLTRGLTWRLVGVSLLFVVVLGITALATQLVFGTVFALVLGREAAATIAFLTGIVVAVISTGFSVVALTFIAQLYVAVAGPPQSQP